MLSRKLLPLLRAWWRWLKPNVTWFICVIFAEWRPVLLRETEQ